MSNVHNIRWHKQIPTQDLDLLCEAFRDIWDLKNWTVSYPSQWLQTDSQNCGVFVCTMAEMEVRNISVQTEHPAALQHLRCYHATALAASTHMVYTRNCTEE